MASNWSLRNLGAVCTKIGSGATPRGGSEVYQEHGKYALIRSQNIYNDGFHHGGLAFIGEEHAAELNGVEVQEGDVLLNITGDSVARVCQVDPRVLPARVNQHVAIIRPRPDKLDARFLRYFLVSPEMQSKLLSWAGAGGTRNALTKGMIESFDVLAPARIAEQKSIAHILGTLDDKIDLNRRMAATLEEMARALFKEWFVDFAPPFGCEKSQFRDSTLGEIPVGWGVGSLVDLVEHSRVQDDPRAEPATQFLHYSLPAFDDGLRPVPEAGESIKSTKFRVPPDCVLLSKLNPEIDRTWLVDVAEGGRAIASTEFLVLLPRPPFTSAYIYSLVRSPGVRRTLEGLVTGTSKSHQRAQPGDILGIQVPLPPAEIVAAFNRAATPLLHRAQVARRESIALGELRDTLLPKLLSGELPVGGMDSFGTGGTDG